MLVEIPDPAARPFLGSGSVSTGARGEHHLTTGVLPSASPRRGGAETAEQGPCSYLQARALNVRGQVGVLGYPPTAPRAAVFPVGSVLLRCYPSCSDRAVLAFRALLCW